MRFHVPRSITTLSLVPLLLAIPPIQDDPAILGFTVASTERQRAIEAAYDARLDPEELEAWMYHLTRRPFFVGSPGARENAEWVAEQYRAWGYETEIEVFDVLFPTPTVRELEMVGPTRYRATLEEPVLSEDATSGVDGRLPTYNAYSADGDVTGELVYVNYGVPDDYDELERRGISVEGKIVIARYGGSWRGIKPKVAAEHGAIATILYSDPRDDGYYQGDVYPEGPYRMEHGVQRGSVADMPTYPGDPLTPFVGATEDAERLSVAESPTIMKIPVLPISWSDAQPLLDALEGPVAPPSWRGALPLTYHIGPGPARVRVHVEFNWDLAPAYNVIARLEGGEHPDQWVLRGNHRDGWAMGAADPISGHVAMMAEAKAIGELAREGMRPKRTIVYASWDAEEPGLIGSTEWGEHHADELREHAVAYINTDGSGRGFLGAGGSHSLERMMNEVAKDVTDPQTGVTVWERWRARVAVGGDQEALTRDDLRIYPLGSGSDYTPFLQHLGIASLNLGFGGENGGGSYHSQFDSFDHYTRFGDPGLRYGVALAQVAGRATLRLANADVLPHHLGGLVDNVRTYVDEIEELTASMRAETERMIRMVDEGLHRLAADPTERYVPPGAPDRVPHLAFAPVQNALADLARRGAEYDDAVTSLLADPEQTARVADAVNGILLPLERRLTSDDGLPRRPWFRHQIYAPGYYTGYGVKTLPGIREAIEQRDWLEAERQIPRVAAALAAVTADIERALEIIQGPPGMVP